ncbi:MAG TPA: hypothetical protein VFS22_00510 [Flavisolibacter sp.]|nr:hypothetical protein [Flavisolibacter sp.]
MIGLFKQKSPGNVVVLLIFGLLVKLPLFLYPKNSLVTNNDGPLYQAFVASLPSANAYLSSLIAFGLLYLQAVLVTYIANEYRMMTRQNYLPGMAYLLITSLLPEWSYLSAPLVTTTLVIWIFIKLFRLYNTANAKAQIFNIGLVAGIGSYIYFPSAGFIICILLGLMILKPFKFNEIVLFLLGCLTPYYFYAVYLFLSDRLSLKTFVPHVSVTVPVMKSSIWLAASTLLLALPFLIGGYFIQVHLRKMLIQVRKNWSILLLYLLLAFFVPFINSNHSFHAWVLIAAPFSLFHACAYFYQPRGFISLLLFLLTVGYILYLQFGTPTWH